jgi:hypothetical protein
MVDKTQSRETMLLENAIENLGKRIYGLILEVFKNKEIVF